LRVSTRRIQAAPSPFDALALKPIHSTEDDPQQQ
jgi:hypothetical protein